MLRIIVLLLLTISASPAAAYIGPGAGISVLGSLLGILATIVVAIGAGVWLGTSARVRAASANEKLNIACIGVGGKGWTL